jgi:probable rRNA maturation factor
MILIDPDLASDPDRRPNPKPGPVSPESRKAERDARLPSTRLPSIRTLNAYLREAQSAVRLNGAVSVLLTTDAKIKTLNRDFRRKNKATDVLSFPADPIPGIRRSEQPAGDLAISVPTALNQARDQGHRLGTEIKVLILHGLLHLAGYDHETDSGQMARRERTLRARLKLPLGLIERAHSANRPRTSRAPSSRLLSGARVGDHKGAPATKKTTLNESRRRS